MQKAIALLLATLFFAHIFTSVILAQSSGGSGKDPFGSVVTEMKNSTKGMSNAMADAAQLVFAIIGVVLFLYGFYVAVAGDNRLKGIWLLIGAFLCLSVAGIVRAFLNSAT